MSTARKELWAADREADREAAKTLGRTDAPSFGAAARVALHALLRRTGHEVSLATLHAWTQPMQGHAYQWAIGFLQGDRYPPPGWVRSFGSLGDLRTVLRRAGYDVTVADLARWTRPMQGHAYLWAQGFALGGEDVPAPEWVALDGVWKGRP